jgi:hypothetical protein
MAKSNEAKTAAAVSLLTIDLVYNMATDLGEGAIRFGGPPLTQVLRSQGPRDSWPCSASRSQPIRVVDDRVWERLRLAH